MYHPQPAAVNDGYQSIESIGWFIFHDLHLTHLIELVHGRIAPGQAEVEAWIPWSPRSKNQNTTDHGDVYCSAIPIFWRTNRHLSHSNLPMAIYAIGEIALSTPFEPPQNDFHLVKINHFQVKHHLQTGTKRRRFFLWEVELSPWPGTKRIRLHPLGFTS